MTQDRPDPSALLEQVKAQEQRQRRGKLKIFFGAAPGVGKTYAMLQAALKIFAEGVDVIIGYVETHGRQETEALLLGLTLLPSKSIEYRGTQLREFDLDAALARKPEILVVDELAHTNAPGSRFPKRWQDVQELLQAGINVYTTLNVQHLESLNDVIAQITGVTVRETVPDSIVENADEVELVDLPPDVLLERMREGKVYVPDMARQAVTNFFRKSNLTALRELALRRTAEWVDRQMQDMTQERGRNRVWPASDRIMVCVGPSPSSATLLRAAKRMAVGLRADLIAVYVETPASARLSQADRDRIVQTFRLAESLGAEPVTITGRGVSEEIVNYARSRNISRIVIGKPTMPRWREMFKRSLVDDLVRCSGDLDIFVLRGEGDGTEPAPKRAIRPTSSWTDYAAAVGFVALSTGIGELLFRPFQIESTNIAMIYLLGVLVTAMRFGKGPSALSAILSVAAFDYFFVPPQMTFAVSDSQYLISFAVMLAVGLVISRLTVMIREQATTSQDREHRTAALYAMSRELAASRNLEEILPTGTRHLRETFESSITALLPDGSGMLRPSEFDAAAMTLSESDGGVAQWSFDHSKNAGLGTGVVPSANVLCLPLVASRGKVGVICVKPRDPARLLSAGQLLLLETFTNQLALAIERGKLIREANESQLRAETERVRSALLSSVSHDLRTPLAAITGAASSLVEDRDRLDPATARELADSIYSEAKRLNELIGNLIFATRLEAGAVKPRKEWIGLADIVGPVLARLRDRFDDHPIKKNIPTDLPLVQVDGVMIEQVLLNLLDNSLRHTPPGVPIELSAWSIEKAIIVEVADQGPGLNEGEERRIFDPFYQGKLSKMTGGLGLGLTICRGIVMAHGGRIWAENKPNSGVAFRFSLPLEDQQPVIGPESVDAAPLPVHGAQSAHSG